MIDDRLKHKCSAIFWLLLCVRILSKSWRYIIFNFNLHCFIPFTFILNISTDHLVLQCFDTVGWAMLPVKIVPKVTYYVSQGGTLNITHSLAHSPHFNDLMRPGVMRKLTASFTYFGDMS